MPRTRAPYRPAAGFLAIVLVATAAVGTAAAQDEPDVGAFDRAREPGIRALVDRELGVGALSRMSATSGPILHDVPPRTIGPASSQWFTDEFDGTIVFFGEVWNRTNSRHAFVSLDILLRNTSNVIVGTGRGQVILYSLASGARSIFIGFVEEPTMAWATYDISVAASEIVRGPVGGPLDAALDPPFVDAEGKHYTGTFTNLTPSKVNDAVVYLSQYDSAGRLVDIWADNFVAGIPAGDTAAFEMIIPEEVPGVVRSSVVVEAFIGSPFEFTDVVYSWPNYFDDIGLSVFRDDVVWIAEQGITTGCGAGRFCPSANVPRDEMASFLGNALGLGGSAPNAFTDDEGNAHEASINRVAKAGITTGCGGTSYCPGTPVSRDQMASFLARAAGLGGAPADAFSDDDGNLHETDIDRIAAAGIASGCGPARYCPSRLVTRGEMAAFLRRAFD